MTLRGCDIRHRATINVALPADAFCALACPDADLIVQGCPGSCATGIVENCPKAAGCRACALASTPEREQAWVQWMIQSGEEPVIRYGLTVAMHETGLRRGYLLRLVRRGIVGFDGAPLFTLGDLARLHGGGLADLTDDGSLSFDEAAARLGLSKSSVRKLVADGTLDAIGGAVRGRRISTQSVDDLCHRKKQEEKRRAHLYRVSDLSRMLGVDRGVLRIRAAKGAILADQTIDGVTYYNDATFRQLWREFHGDDLRTEGGATICGVQPELFSEAGSGGKD